MKKQLLTTVAALAFSIASVSAALAYCTSDAQCPQPGFCDLAMQNCWKQAVPIGLPCARDLECNYRLLYPARSCNFYYNGTCQQKQGYGGRCTKATDCRSGRCNVATYTCY